MHIVIRTVMYRKSKSTPQIPLVTALQSMSAYKTAVAIN